MAKGHQLEKAHLVVGRLKVRAGVNASTMAGAECTPMRLEAGLTGLVAEMGRTSMLSSSTVVVRVWDGVCLRVITSPDRLKGRIQAKLRIQAKTTDRAGEVGLTPSEAKEVDLGEARKGTAVVVTVPLTQHKHKHKVKVKVKVKYKDLAPKTPECVVISPPVDQAGTTWSTIWPERSRHGVCPSEEKAMDKAMDKAGDQLKVPLRTCVLTLALAVREDTVLRSVTSRLRARCSAVRLGSSVRKVREVL